MSAATFTGLMLWNAKHEQPPIERLQSLWLQRWVIRDDNTARLSGFFMLAGDSDRVLYPGWAACYPTGAKDNFGFVWCVPMVSYENKGQGESLLSCITACTGEIRKAKHVLMPELLTRSEQAELEKWQSGIPRGSTLLGKLRPGESRMHRRKIS